MLSDLIAKWLGSWTFLIVQTTILAVWVLSNIEKIVSFDPYPFILLNLFLSFQAAYATPLLLMSSNRSAAKDRAIMEQDLQTDQETNHRLEVLNEQVESLINDVKSIKRLLSKKNRH
jgi:uncharacterized membrane protein